MKQLAKKIVYTATSIVSAFALMTNTAMAATIDALPTADGSTLQWATSGGNHFGTLDESPCNNGTDYVGILSAFSGTKTDIITSDISALSGSTITNVQLHACVMKTVKPSPASKFTVNVKLQDSGSTVDVGTFQFSWGTYNWQTLNSSATGTSYVVQSDSKVVYTLYAFSSDYGSPFKVSQLAATLTY